MVIQRVSYAARPLFAVRIQYVLRFFVSRHHAGDELTNPCRLAKSLGLADASDIAL